MQQILLSKYLNPCNSWTFIHWWISSKMGNWFAADLLQKSQQNSNENLGQNTGSCGKIKLKNKSWGKKLKNKGQLCLFVSKTSKNYIDTLPKYKEYKDIRYTFFFVWINPILI